MTQLADFVVTLTLIIAIPQLVSTLATEGAILWSQITKLITPSPRIKPLQPPKLPLPSLASRLVTKKNLALPARAIPSLVTYAAITDTAVRAVSIYATTTARMKWRLMS